MSDEEANEYDDEDFDEDIDVEVDEASDCSMDKDEESESQETHSLLVKVPGVSKDVCNLESEGRGEFVAEVRVDELRENPACVEDDNALSLHLKEESNNYPEHVGETARGEEVTAFPETGRALEVLQPDTNVHFNYVVPNDSAEEEDEGTDYVQHDEAQRGDCKETHQESSLLSLRANEELYNPCDYVGENASGEDETTFSETGTYEKEGKAKHCAIDNPDVTFGDEETTASIVQDTVGIPFTSMGSDSEHGSEADENEMEAIPKYLSEYSIVVKDWEEETSNRTGSGSQSHRSHRNCTPQSNPIGSAPQFSFRSDSPLFSHREDSPSNLENSPPSSDLSPPHSEQETTTESLSFYQDDYVPSSTKTSPPPTCPNDLGLESQESWLPMTESMPPPNHNASSLLEALQKRASRVRPSSDPGSRRDSGSGSLWNGLKAGIMRSRTLLVPEDFMMTATAKDPRRQVRSAVAGTHKIRTTNFASRGPRVRGRRIVPEVKEAEKEEEEEQKPIQVSEDITDEPVVEEVPEEMPKAEPVPEPRMIIRKSMLQPTRDKLDGLLWNFEGVESKDEVEARLRLTHTKRRGEVVREADRFLHMMKDKGGGSVTVAWRRHFDSDGDGELSFLEFCNALADLKYDVDTIKLWKEFGGGYGHKHVGLEVIDPHGANVLEFFSNWCHEEKGGPLEVFMAMDADGSDSLEPHEFVEGLQELGFFDVEALPEGINTEEKVLQNLYPLLDQNGRGCVQADQMLFLEQDREKRERQLLEIHRARDCGVDLSLAGTVSNDAHNVLHRTTMGCTQLGGKFWKMIPENNIPYGTRSIESTPASSPQKSPIQSIAKARLLQDRSRLHTLAKKDTGSEAAAYHVSFGLPTSVSLPQLPSDTGRGRLRATKRNNAEIRLRSTHKMRGARNIYGGALTSLPLLSNHHERTATSVVPTGSRRRQKAPAQFCSDDKDVFDPKVSAPMDFFSSGNSRALFDRYYA